MYRVFYSKQAIKALKRMPRNSSQRVVAKINELAKNPYNCTQVKMLKGVGANRLRVGDWRVIYTVNDDVLEIWIVKVASRGEVYKS